MEEVNHIPRKALNENALEDDSFAGLSPGVRESKRAFLRDLPCMLQHPAYDRWCAAYHGSERIGIAESEKDLIRECQRRGLKRDQYYLGVIAPHSSIIEEVDPSLYEFDPIDE